MATHSGFQPVTGRLHPPSCWVQLDVFFYVTVVAFIVLVLLCNTCVFIVVLVQIRRMKANKSSENGRMSLRDLRTVASLTVLLGLTWITGFFSFGPGRVVLIYLFTIFNSSQGEVFLGEKGNLNQICPHASFLSRPRSVYFCVPLFDEGKREEPVESPTVLPIFQRQRLLW